MERAPSTVTDVCTENVYTLTSTDRLSRVISLRVDMCIYVLMLPQLARHGANYKRTAITQTPRLQKHNGLEPFWLHQGAVFTIKLIGSKALYTVWWHGSSFKS